MPFQLTFASFLYAFSSMYFYINFGVFLGGGNTPQGSAGGQGGDASGCVGKLHFGVRTAIFLCVFQHSGKVVAKRPRDSHLSDLSQVTLQVPLGSCTGNLKKGGIEPRPPVTPALGGALARRGGYIYIYIYIYIMG